MNGGDRRASVCRAAMELIAERGLDRTTMRAIGERAGMSAGHVAYYFGSRDRILIETLTWSEAELTIRRRAALARIRDPWKKLGKLIDLYVPDKRLDPRWALWMEIVRLAPDDAETLGTLDSLEREWQDDLAAILDEGKRAGTFRGDAIAAVHTRLVLLLEGLATQVYTGTRAYPRARAIRIAMEAAESELQRVAA